MLTSLIPSDAWTLSPKQRLAYVLGQRPAVCRIAPSPTGHVHMGTVRTALHNFLAAKASGGTFFLRVDDTDQSRNDDAHVRLIHDSLDRFGLTPAFSFHQSSRQTVHQQAAQLLLSRGLAIQDGTAVRLRGGLVDLLPSRFFDVAAGVCSISDTLASHADGLVLLRSDGMPTYHFASTVDDIHAGTTLILRGMDHLANTPKQVLVALVLAQAGWPGADDFCRNVCFAHVGLILTKDGKKVSKRDGSSNVMATLDGGVDARAYLQWVLKLGWGHPASDFDKQHPLLSLNDMASVFSQGGLRSTNATLDLPKLDSLNRLWSRKSSDQYP